MKICNECFLRKVGDTWYLQATNDHEKKMIFLNETGAFLWKNLEEYPTEEELVKLLLQTYEVEEATAIKDVSKFLRFLQESGFLESEERS